MSADQRWEKKERYGTNVTVVQFFKALSDKNIYTVHILQNLTRLQLLQDRRGLEGHAMTPSIVCFNVLFKSQ